MAYGSYDFYNAAGWQGIKKTTVGRSGSIDWIKSFKMKHGGRYPTIGEYAQEYGEEAAKSYRVASEPLAG